MKSSCKTPCRECPFKRESAPGWLGDDDADGFMETTMADHEMPCHLTVDYNDPEWKEKMVDSARQCAGAAIFFSNIAKLSRDPRRARLPADKALVFARREEFRVHHRPKPRRRRRR